MAVQQYKSLINDVPNRIEMQDVTHELQNVLTVDELAKQLDEARKGKARVDSKYVDYQSRGHLYDYKINYPEFLDDITHIIKEGKNRPLEDRYHNPHEMLIK